MKDQRLAWTTPQRTVHLPAGEPIERFVTIDMPVQVTSQSREVPSPHYSRELFDKASAILDVIGAPDAAWTTLCRGSWMRVTFRVEIDGSLVAVRAEPLP